METYRASRRRFGFGMVAAVPAGLALMAAPAVGAQTPESETDEITRTISVNGTGTVKIAPDTASISLGVLANDESLEVAQQTVSDNLASTTAALTDAGILAEDIATNSYNVYPVSEYDRNGNYVGIERYEVSSGLTVIVRDIDSVGTVLDLAVQAGANNVWGISFYVDDSSAAASQARQAAVDDARAKADELATASGMVIVGVISISENYAPPVSPMDYSFEGAGGASKDMVASSMVPVSPGQSQISVDVSIVFEVELAAG